MFSLHKSNKASLQESRFSYTLLVPTCSASIPHMFLEVANGAMINNQLCLWNLGTLTAILAFVNNQLSNEVANGAMINNQLCLWNLGTLTAILAFVNNQLSNKVRT